MRPSDEKIIDAVFDIFGTRIQRCGSEFLIIDENHRTNCQLVKHIDDHIVFLNRKISQ